MQVPQLVRSSFLPIVHLSWWPGALGSSAPLEGSDLVTCSDTCRSPSFLAVVVSSQLACFLPYALKRCLPAAMPLHFMQTWNHLSDSRERLMEKLILTCNFNTAPELNWIAHTFVVFCCYKNGSNWAWFQPPYCCWAALCKHIHTFFLRLYFLSVGFEEELLVRALGGWSRVRITPCSDWGGILLSCAHEHSGEAPFWFCA